MAYDSQRRVTVLFGGSTDGFGFLGDTWEWNGTTWTQRATNGPAPRYAHAMAYDSQRGVTVLFGGGNSNGYSGDTWEWNGTTWTLRATPGPSGRGYHAMAYDSQRGVTVMFGGTIGGPAFNDTWEWSGTAWIIKTPTAPEARVYHSMAYDSQRGVTIICGGFSTSVLEWNGTSWTLSSVVAPPARIYGSLAYDNQRQAAVLFGGYAFGTGVLGDTWYWNGTTWTLRATNGPASRYAHAMAYDSHRGSTVLFGGHADGGIPFGDTWGLLGPPAASIVGVGSGCAGSNGVPTLTPAMNSVPRIGSTLSLTLNQLPPLATVCVPFFGFSNVSFGSTPLPAMLDPYGMPGCALLADAFASYFVLGLSGTASWSVGIPFSPFFSGTHVYLQSLVFDPAAPNPAGIVITNGLDATIGY